MTEGSVAAHSCSMRITKAPLNIKCALSSRATAFPGHNMSHRVRSLVQMEHVFQTESAH
jgi:hypothetical protein